jgi:hypothetical protein
MALLPDIAGEEPPLASGWDRVTIWCHDVAVCPFQELSATFLIIVSCCRMPLSHSWFMIQLICRQIVVDS